MNRNENDEVEVMLIKDKFYLATDNPKYQYYKRAFIPRKLWDLHNELEPKAIDVNRRIMLYFKTPKDKPMFVARYHVEEDERHTFNEDGTVTIIKKSL